MRKTTTLSVLAAAALAAAPVSTAKHDRPDPVEIELSKKATALSSGLAKTGIRRRLQRFGFKAKRFKGTCRGDRKVKTCTYKFDDKLSGAILGVPYCSSKEGTRVRLVDRGETLRVGATPTVPC